ncbi:hypothetical protein HBH70_016610 [Parastagonospora nodorum]|nr:hypothetical protein HBH53_002440 [Parastagonospora nodorum]KAH4178074.1 hypothetical protein HBH43_040030 [Parastagonospora nodorum]KAH4861501.1 hypothetical protein HBH75_027380 [Parastagonospora nodorum]KAH4940708.1 hypothetical protein HBH74_069490 [Parastagonospora nodorum]KAH4972366.1 hypothetical protein HBI78_026180 [Parastagonospora nodorum]
MLQPGPSYLMEGKPKRNTNRAVPSPLRPSTPTRQLRENPDLASPPTTPLAAMDINGDVVMGAQGVLMPPSPSFLNGVFEQEQAAPTLPGLTIGKAKLRVVSQDRTSAGVKKSKTKSKATVSKLVDSNAGAAAALIQQAVQTSFRFMELPGEIRNLIYHHALSSPKQALLVHRPRMASLRPRTRLDRQRALDSDVKDRELGYQLSLSLSTDKSRRANKDTKSAKKRETNRPFWGLTQVSHQVRQEFRPIYLQKQEIGMDLTEIVKYLQTFYFDAPEEFTKLDTRGKRALDMPFNGNLTIAVGEKPGELEKHKDGVEVIPLLDLWANSFKIEAGFGRYLKNDYVPQTDGEAKDLYRLFGRRVLKNRQCSGMNHSWRTILRSRALASVTLHRKPAPITVDTVTLPLSALPTALLIAQRPLPTRITIDPKPFIHMQFRPECAESWMTQPVSTLPPDWLHLCGFGGMEHFDVKVGVAPRDVDNRL